MNALTTNTTDVQRLKNHIFDDELFPLLDSVYTFAYRLTNDAVQAEDLAQDTYFKAWKSLDTYTSGTNARAWLFQICRNAFYNEYRTKSRAPRKVDFEDIVAFHNEDDPVTPRYFGLQHEMNDRLLGDEVTKAILALPDNFRTVLLLDLEDFTYEEIAALCEIPIGTVRSRLHRARNVLADLLRQYALENGYETSPAEAENEIQNAQNEAASTQVAVV